MLGVSFEFEFELEFEFEFEFEFGSCDEGVFASTCCVCAFSLETFVHTCSRNLTRGSHA